MADEKDPFAEFGGTVVTNQDDPFKEFGGVVVKKKSTPSGGPNTLPQLNNGFDISHPFQAPSDLIPVLPEHRDEIRAQQQADIQAQTNYFKKLRSELDPEAQKNFDKAIEISMAKHPDVLGVPTKEEIDHYNRLQTPTGKIIGAAKYIGSEATHGTLQMAKGLAHVVNMGTNPGAAITGIDPTDAAFDYLDKKADLGLTANDKAQIEEMSVPTVNGHKIGIGKGIAMAAQLANFAPSITAGESAGIPKTLLYLQGLGQAKEQADKMTDLNPLAKEALIQGGGLVNMTLHDLGGKYFGKGVSNAVKDKVVTGIATNALKEAAEKGVGEAGYKALLEGKAQSFAEKFNRTPAEVLKHYTDAAKTFTKLNVGNYAVHKAVDKIQEASGDNPVFNENLGNLAETESNTLTKQVPMFGSLGALGAVSKLMPNSGYENDITKAVINDPSPANIDNIKNSIAQHGNENGWNDDEIKATHDHIDKIAKAVQSLPATIKDKTKAVGLVLDRNELQAELDQSVGAREKLDPAVAEIPSPKEQYLTDKIEQANDKLRGLVSEKKLTYSKGLAVNNEEGKFFKTTGDVKEEITPTRYDLENTEREAKKQIDEQTAPNKEVSVEQPADETVSVPADQNVETTENSPIKPVENETNTEKSSQESGEKGSTESTEVDKTVRPEKGELVETPVEQVGFKRFEDIIKESANSEEAYQKAKKLKDVPTEVAQAFREKYDPKENLSPQEAFTRFYDEIKPEDNVAKKALIESTEAKAKELKNKNNATEGKLKEQKSDLLNQMGEVKKALRGDDIAEVVKLGYEVSDDDKVTFQVKDDGEFKVHKDWLAGNDAIDQLKKEFTTDLNKTKPADINKDSKVQRPGKPGIGTDIDVNYVAENIATARNAKNEKMQAFWEKEYQRIKGEPYVAKETRAEQPETIAENKRPANPKQEADSPSQGEVGSSTKAGDPLREFANKVREGKISKLSGFRASTGFDGVWDASLEVVAKSIEGGAKIADAIEAGLKYIRSTDWYKSLSDKKEFEDKYTEHMTQEYASHEKAEDTPEMTGIRHADTAKERADEGKESDVPKKDRSRETIEAKGKELIDEDPDYANRIAKEIIDKERPATAVEQAALEYRKTQLKNERRRILKDTEPDNASENEIKLAKITDEISLNQKATDIGGSELGSGLGYRTQLMNEDYSTETVLGRAKVANGGEELEPKDKAELEKRTKRIEELENERDDLVERLKKQAENRLVDKVHRTANFEGRQAKREVTKASLRKEREGLLAELQLMAKKSRGTLGANNIPVEMIGPLTKLARNYVLDGATTLSAVVDKLYNDLKDHIEDVSKEDIANSVKENFEKYLTEQNSLRLGRAKKLQQTKLEKLKSEDFEKKTYAKILVDNDYLNIRAEINREQQRINKKLSDIENSKKSINRKVVETAVKFARQAKLASVTVLGKLAATGIATVGIKPVQEAVGKGLSVVLPRVAEKSSVEGSVSRKLLREANTVTEGAAVKSISEAIARAATIGMKDSWQEMTGAGSNLTNLYKERGATLPSEAKEFFGHIHSAIKAPIKRFAWELSYAKRTAKMIELGFDPLDPINDAQNRLNAYKDGERAIFMGDNTLSKIYENNVGSLEKSSSSINRTLAATFRILLPFVKVPSNIVLEGAKYSFGSVSGLARLGRAMTKGMDNLTPEEADIILEHLKKGSVGGAALAYGFFNPNQFGGFYQQGEKKKIAPKHIKIGDINIPEFLVEHPVYTAAQVGANFRHLLDKYRHKDDKIPTAALATMAGLGYNVPQANEIKRLVDMTADIKSMDKWKKFSGETLRGAIEPAALIQLAEITDVKEGAKTAVPGLAFTEHTQQKRQPKLRKKQFMKYLLQMVESGIPGLRKNVPKKH